MPQLSEKTCKFPEFYIDKVENAWYNTHSGRFGVRIV